VPENLGALAAAVREHGADVGFAQDMDGDRLAIVDETGRPIGEELTLVLAAEPVLRRTPGPLVANLATTDALDAMAARHGCRVFRTKVGEANVAEGMRAHHAPIGGEGNGGVIWPAVNFARDSLVGMALVLHQLAASGERVSSLAAAYDRFHVVKLLRHCPAEQARAILRRAREAWADRPVDLTDGVKVRLEDGWFILRGSNTEPIVRVIAEGPSEERARAIAQRVMDDVGAWIA
jgi:phosphomannomutase